MNNAYRLGCLSNSSYVTTYIDVRLIPPVRLIPLVRLINMAAGICVLTIPAEPYVGHRNYLISNRLASIIPELVKEWTI